MMNLKKIINAVLPPACLGCRSRLLSHEHYFCTSCMAQWTPANIHGTVSDNELARLFWGFFPIDGAAAVYSYIPGTSIGTLLHTMKYGNKADLCRMMGRQMAANDAVIELLQPVEVLIPVPLTPKRQHMRGYNQAEEMCRGIAEVTGLEVCNDVLERVRFADSQTAMSREERLENIRGAFRLADGTKVSGKHIAVVDDIITTGATVSECLLMLRDVPDLHISVLSLGWTSSY